MSGIIRKVEVTGASNNNRQKDNEGVTSLDLSQLEHKVMGLIEELQIRSDTYKVCVLNKRN